MKNHPSRIELINAAKVKSGNYSGHFKSCDWCRIYFELLKDHPFAGELPLTDAPNNWIAKAIALADKSGKVARAKSAVLELIFDSWAMPLPAGVRGEGLLQERRVRFELFDKTFDLRAEHRRNRWDFVAKVTDKDGRNVDCTLIAGKKELTANEDGFYQWSSARPPVRFSIITDESELKTPEISWKKSQAE